MPTCLNVEYNNSVCAELPDIPSNFDTAGWIEPASSGTCFPDGNDGKLRLNCVPSHLNHDDMILYPGQPGKAHLHQYFGNTLSNAHSTYESLRTTGNGTCSGGPINRTAYWHPAIIRPQNNKVVQPTSYTVYYTVGHERVDQCLPVFGWQYACRRFPRGFAFICGWPDYVPPNSPNPTEARPDLPWKVWNVLYNNAWVSTNALGSFAALADACNAAGKALTPTTDQTSKLIGRFSFPSCWDGKTLSSANGRTHVTYKRQNGYGNHSCPASHPHNIPEVLFAINVDHNGADDFRQWYLSSDDGHGAPAESYPGAHTTHADWKFAWDQPVVDTFTLNVHGIGEGSKFITCNNGGLNNGTKLKENHLGNRNFRAEATRYADIPALPGVEPEPEPPPVLSTIASLTLVNADTGADIGPLGTTLDLAALPTKNLNVRANTSPAVVTSVSFDLDGVVTTETGAPYAMKGDVSGVYNKWTPSVGAHVLKVTPTNAGVVGTQTTANFTVSDTVVPPIPPEPPVVVYRWQAYKTGKSTLYRFYENNVEVIDALSLTEARWLSGILKITPP